MKFITEILLTGLAVALASYFVPGVQVNGFITAIIVGVLLALANATIGFVLRILTFPINVLSLGLMSFIITVCMVLLVDNFLSGFSTSGFWSAMIFALVLSFLKIIFGSFKSSGR
ncbi:MAG: phage holin family protein [Sphingobacteriales bacterium]|nr:MAG: phage holin family protein [Sphingobacteriales bacterium]TAF82566.1 MAG: phage holin family protein [Sphingobacteriales bacterium]